MPGKNLYLLLFLAFSQPLMLISAPEQTRLHGALADIIDFSQFKANLKKFAHLPNKQLHFLYNWGKKKYALYKAKNYKDLFRIVDRDDKHAALLLGAGAVVIILTAFGIYKATRWGIRSAEYQMILMKYGVNIPNSLEPPLYKAARANDFNAVRILVNHGADINAPIDKDGNTMWDKIEKNSSIDENIEQFLKTHGAKTKNDLREKLTVTIPNQKPIDPMRFQEGILNRFEAAKIPYTVTTNLDVMHQGATQTFTNIDPKESDTINPIFAEEGGNYRIALPNTDIYFEVKFLCEAEPKRSDIRLAIMNLAKQLGATLEDNLSFKNFNKKEINFAELYPNNEGSDNDNDNEN